MTADANGLATILVLASVILVGYPNAAFANQATPAITAGEAKETMQWAMSMVQSNLPPRYEKKKNWDATKRVYAGIEIDNDGLRLKTHRRFKEVRHGKWLRYTIDLENTNDPDRLRIEVTGAELVTPGLLRMTTQIDVHSGVEAQQQRWNRGLQLYSVTVRGQAKFRLTVATDIAFGFDYSRVPPDIVFDPVVAGASIELIDLEIDRISRLGSDIAEEIGDFSERLLRDDFLPEQQDRLPEKLNKQIDRQRDKLRISASDWLTRQLTTTAK